MAYGKQSAQYSRPNNTNAARGGGSTDASLGAKPEVILSSGLFRPRSEKSKAVASVVIDIPTDIVAGTTVYLDLYQNEVVEDGKPLFKLQMKKKQA